MAPQSAPITIEPLTLADIPAAMALVEAAGWNQTPHDWRRVIQYQPLGCFKAVHQGGLVGTVTSISYGTELSWIGMMLVDTAMRRQGIGRLLMNRVIDYLKSTNVRTIKLDATPLGRPLYELLGFQMQWNFQRYYRLTERPDDQPMAPPNESFHGSALTDAMPEHLLELDRQAFGVDRSQWLATVLKENCSVQLTLAGFGAIRHGRVADYIGPITASSEEAACLIARALVSKSSRDLFWDIPRSRDDDSPRLFALAKGLGFRPVRDLSRMTLEFDTTTPQLQYQFAICDPASG